MAKGYSSNIMDSSVPLKKSRKRGSPKVTITSDLRMEMLILITDFGLSCYLAAQVLDLPYTNAKVMYRGGVISRVKGSMCFIWKFALPPFLLSDAVFKTKMHRNLALLITQY